MSGDRRSRVLRAIVEDYVATNEPVGSKALVERHGLGVSPATIRNDMAALERDGFIAQPHTSAGRVPTDKGYRVFVDRIDEVKPLSAAERRAISKILSEPVDVDDMVDRTVRLLAGLTHQVAVMQYPTPTRSNVRHVELVDIAAGRLLVVLITDNGTVEQRIVDIGRALTETALVVLRDTFNRALAGARVDEIATRCAGIVLPEDTDAAEAISTVLGDLARSMRTDRVVMAGTANLARAGQDFTRHLGPLLEAFEEQVVILKLLSSMSADSEHVSVRIGSENSVDSFTSTSVVATGYGAGDNEASLAVLGPTRMDYPTNMAAVRAVAAYVSVILSE